MNYIITPAQARLPAYQARLREEIETGADMSLADLQARSIEHPVIVAYQAELAGSSPNSPYQGRLDGLLRRMTRRQICLSLGAGMGRVEKHLVEAKFCGVFEQLDVSTRGGAEFSDLNFVQLELDHYDLVLCHGSLHHLINLEHILDQIDRALKPDGVFLVYEYVGPTQWQFSQRHLQLLQSAFPQFRFSPPKRWQIPGFEAVRSGRLLPLIWEQFSEPLWGASFGATYFPVVTCCPGKQWKPEIAEVIEHDRKYAQPLGLEPCYHMGLYTKTSRAPVTASPWSDNELEYILTREFPWHARIKNALRRSVIGPALRTFKRKVLP